MQLLDKHIILIGFKHAGKSVIGEQLAIKIANPFIDLDQKIEYLFSQKFKKKLLSRQIMQTHGENFFRTLENEALIKTLSAKPSVIATGGGTPLTLENQALLKPHLLISIKAPQERVFKSIMASGQPAFFSAEEDSYESFKKLWEQREKIYETLADFSVNNAGSVEEAVLEIVEILNRV